jgi:hypothetical protein
MNSTLATTGTAQLLEQLSAFVPDEFINDLVLTKRRLGRRSLYSPAQLYRVHLLVLLTTAHSFNLLVALLGENRSWRRFARLSHRQCVPDAKMLHQFREAAGVAALRRIIAVFENLLPDSDLLRKRIAEKVGAKGTDAYSLPAL